MTAHTLDFTFGAGDVGASCPCGLARYQGANVGAIDPSGDCPGAPVTSHSWQRSVIQNRVIAGCQHCGIVRMGRCPDPWEAAAYAGPAIDLSGECAAVAVPA